MSKIWSYFYTCKKLQKILKNPTVFLSFFCRESPLATQYPIKYNGNVFSFPGTGPETGKKGAVSLDKLKQRIREEGKIRGTNQVLKVDSFLNHQIDTAFLAEIGQAFRERFAGCPVDRILTIEASGIGIATAAAPAFDYAPVVFAKKNKTKNIAGDVYISQAESFTQNRRPYNIFVSKEFLKAGDKVLLMDDFLANGSALEALIDIARQAGAEIVGAAIVIEKAFQPGGQRIRDQGVRVESLARIQSMSEENGIVFMD